ncbi:MAG: hypothetical protein P9L99_06765 [Candidatus Lernaella stagnicola]|nr:hypothetical protein [Candidatus Lernaella stagnicola]
MKRSVWFAVIIAIVLASPAAAGWSATPYLKPYMQLDLPVLAAPLADPYEVGEQRTFWGWDLSGMPPANIQFTATCRGASDFGYVFVADALWGDAMDQDDVDAVLEAWDETSPAGSVDPDSGIYDIEVELFGDPPDTDGVPGVVLLYYEMNCFMGTCFDGFYRYDDQTAGPYSNEMDMVHLDPTVNDPGDDYMLGVAAHEFNHMLQMVHDVNETAWLSESLAEAAMIVTGYDTDTGWLADFAADPTTGFFGDETNVHYGAALLLGTYLYEAGGATLLQAVTADSDNGVESIENHLPAGDVDNFGEFFGDMALAAAADFFVEQLDATTAAQQAYQYRLLSVGELNWTEPSESGKAETSWQTTLPGGSMAALRFDFDTPMGAADVALSDTNGLIEYGVFGAPDGEALAYTRFNNPDDATIECPLGAATTAVLVAANPQPAPVSLDITVTFVEAGAGDDDVTDDDTTGDDDDTTDDDIGDGCGC